MKIHIRIPTRIHRGVAMDILRLVNTEIVLGIPAGVTTEI